MSERGRLGWAQRPASQILWLFLSEGPEALARVSEELDNARSIKDSPTEAFFRAMDAYNAATIFFLATDSPVEKAAVLARYPGRVMVLPTECYHRDLLRGIQDAFREFLGLANCSEILGSAGSSFSEMAAAYGNKALRIIKPTV